MIEGLPADATLGEIVDTLQHLETQTTLEPSGAAEQTLPGGGVWDLLE